MSADDLSVGYRPADDALADTEVMTGESTARQDHQALFGQCHDLLGELARQLSTEIFDGRIAKCLVDVLKVVQALETAVGDIRTERSVATPKMIHLLVQSIDILIDTLGAAITNETLPLGFRSDTLTALKNLVKRAPATVSKTTRKSPVDVSIRTGAKTSAPADLEIYLVDDASG